MISCMERESKLGSKNVRAEAVTQAPTFTFLTFWPGRAVMKSRQRHKDLYTTGRRKCFVQPELHGELETSRKQSNYSDQPKI